MSAGTVFTLRGGTVIDGTGAPAKRADVLIEEGLITAVGEAAPRGIVLDVGGRVVAPGFVDIHSHSDWLLPLEDGARLAAPNLCQGITTVVTGNCGISPAPLGDEFRRGAIERMAVACHVSHLMEWKWRTVAEFFAELETRGLPHNLCMYVGHSTLRATVLGDAQRPPTSGEQAEMAGLLEQGLRDGAVGLSIGLEYFPGRYAGSSEIAELAQLVSRYDALLAAHTRGISSLFEQGIAEAIGFAERSRCRLQIAHVNPMGRTNWDAIDGLFERVDSARATGLDVGFDIVAYTAWTLSALELLPYFVQDLGADAVLALAGTDEGRAHLRERIETSRPSWPPWIGETVTRNIPLEMGWENLILAEPGTEAFADSRNQTLAAVARTRSTDPYSVLFDLLLASGGSARIVNVGYGGDFEDETPLRRLAARPDAIPETDTVPVPVPGRGLQLPLPLFHGTMARFLGHFARDLGLFSLEQAVHRMTALPARRVGLDRRGILTEGAHADVVVFDPTSVGDRGTYLAPEPPAGIEYVFVNGWPVVREGGYDPERLPGEVLRRAA